LTALGAAWAIHLRRVSSTINPDGRHEDRFVAKRSFETISDVRVLNVKLFQEAQFPKRNRQASRKHVRGERQRLQAVHASHLFWECSSELVLGQI
jgi:hypothetical protein